MLKSLFLPTAFGALASASVSLGLAHPSSAADLTFPLSTSGQSLAPERDGARVAHQVIARASDGLFYVDARVNGAPIRFIVDTGSNIVILSPRDAQRANLSSAKTATLAMQTAGGSAAVHRHQIDQIEIAGQTLSGIDGAVVGDGLSVSLLGQSALSRLNSLRLAGDQLELN